MADGQKPLLVRSEQDLLHVWLVAAEEDRLVAQVAHVHLQVWEGKGRNIFCPHIVRRSLERAEAVLTAPTLALEKLETRAPQGVRL